MIKHKISKAYIDNNILYIEDELHNSVNISSSGKIVGGPDITIGYQSVAISITFQDENKTLVEKEINQVVDSIVSELFKVLKAELRK